MWREFDVACLDAIAADSSVDEGPWDGSASNYTDAQYQAACALDRKSCGGKWTDAHVKQRCSLPYKTPSGKVSRKGVHAAAQRVGSVKDACDSAISSAKSSLRAAYKQLGEDPPDSIKNQAGPMELDEELTLASALLEAEGKVWCVPESILERVVAILNDPGPMDMAAVKAMQDVLAATGERKDGGGGIAVVPLHGVITPRPSFLSLLLGGGGGLLAFRNQVKQAVADPEVKSVVLNVDSPGGLVDHVPETAAEIRALREEKPIVAVANPTMGSAAYWIASQAHEIAITPSGMAGSIGAYTTHRDISGALAMRGIKMTLLSAGKYKVDRNPYEPLTDESAARAMQPVNEFYGQFVSDVAKGRDVAPEDVQNGMGEGMMLNAQPAKRAGLVDRVATLTQTVQRLAHNRAKVKGFHSEAGDENEPEPVTGEHFQPEAAGGGDNSSPQEKAEAAELLAWLTAA